VDTGSAKPFPQVGAKWKSSTPETILGVLQDTELRLKKLDLQLRVYDHFKDKQVGNVDSWSLKICYHPSKKENVKSGVKGMCSR